MSNIIYPKGSDEQKHMKSHLMSFIHLQGFKSLKEACEKTKSDYQLIYGLINGQRKCKIETIERFVKAINNDFKVDIVDGKPVIK